MPIDREYVAQKIAEARSARRTPTAQRARGKPGRVSIQIALLDADVAIKAVLDGVADPSTKAAAQAPYWTVMGWTLYRRVIAAQRKELFGDECHHGE